MNALIDERADLPLRGPFQHGVIAVPAPSGRVVDGPWCRMSRHRESEGGTESVRLKRIFTSLAATVGAAFMLVAVTAGPAQADTDPTTTSLTIQSSVVAVGLESHFAMSMNVNAPVGRWIIEAGSPATGLIVLCGGDVSSSTGCFMPAGALPVGNYNLIAIYDGTENSSPSASGLSPLSVVAQQPTSTTLSLSSNTIVFGHEDTEDVQVTVSGDPFNAAQGTTTVLSNGTALAPQCTGLSLFNTTSFCTLNASQLQPGTYQLIATFSGSTNFAGSTSGVTTLTVLAQQPTTTKLTLSPSATVVVGNELTETFSATVTPATSGTPTGAVTVSTGSTPLCGFTLVNGTGRCNLPSASKLSPGTYPLTATYTGDGTYSSSTDTSQTLTVAKVPTTTDLIMSADTIAVGGEDAEVFTVQVTPTTGSGTPTGNVAVKAGATAVCTVILANGTTCSLKPRQLVAGTYQITATYNSDATFAASASTPAQTLTVKKKGQTLIAAKK
jgi:Big-like domain-containing protein